MNKIIAAMHPALESTIMAQAFERRFLITKTGQLVLPLIPLQEFFQLPRNAAIHYVSTDGFSVGPNPKDWRYASCDRKMPIQLISELTQEQGNPTRVMFNFGSVNDQYLRQYRTLRKSRDVIVEDPGEQSAVIFNYAQLAKLYRYTRSIYSEYYKWHNIWATVIDKIIATSQSPRTHLLFIALPQRLPSMQQMTSLATKNLSGQVRDLQTQDRLMFFELWKWMDPEYRHLSLFGKLSAQQLNKVVIVLEDARRTMCFNLGIFNSWIEDKTVKKEDKDPVSHVKMQAVDFQKRFIRGCMGLMQQRPEGLGAGVFDDDSAAAPEEVRVLETTEDKPLEDVSANQTQAQSFDERVQAVLKGLDADIQAHDDESAIVDDDAAEDQTLGSSVMERAAQSTSSFDAPPVSTMEALAMRLDEAAAKGNMTAIEYRRFNRYMDAAVQLENPYGGDKSAHEFAKVELKDTELGEPDLIPDDPTLIDKSMREVVYAKLDGDYIKNTMKKDIVACVQSIQRAGIIVTAHAVEKDKDITGNYETHTVRMVPVEGMPSMVRFRNVVMDNRARIRSGGVNYRYRRQHTDAPIRKISSTEVMIASYYGKTGVTRCERASYSFDRWLQKEMGIRLIEPNSPFTKLHTGNCFDHEVKQPRAYAAMASNWRGMVYNDIELFFNQHTMVADFGQEAVDYVATLGMQLFGKKQGVLYILDDNGTVYTLKDGNTEPVGTFEAFMGLPESDKPVEFTQCRIFGKDLPTGLVLGYYFGLSSLIKMLGATVRQVPTGTRVNLAPTEWSLVFEDYTLVFSQDDKVATLIFSGLNQAAKTIKRYSVYHFDKPAVYFNVLEAVGLNSRYIRELDNLRDMFVDPITERVLKRMGEPTTYPELVKRATEMLTTVQHSRKLDSNEMRYRGAERIPGAIYFQLTRAIREQRSKTSRASAKVEMNPYNVLKHVLSDPSMMLIDDINPIHNLKEISSITYTGHGGRSSRSMTREQRSIDPNDFGTLSEATVDSSDVGFNAYMSVAPRIANTEGMIKPQDRANTKAANMLSAAALATPMAVNDDGRRIGMISIQHSHTVACDSYAPSAVRTGFERVLAHQVDETFASTARLDGIVKSTNQYGITVEYSDGTTQPLATGRRFGKSGGMTLPHDMAATFAVGDKFKKGDVLVYHKGFFKPDRFNRGVVNWMSGTTARVVFLEARRTHEDACSISIDFAKKNGIRVTDLRDVVVGFKQNIHNTATLGSSIKYDDALCLIESELSSQAGLFTQDNINTLKTLSSQAPLAKVSGIIDKIEVFYHGQLEDMCDSLRALAIENDKRLAKECRAAGETVVTGVVDDGFHVNSEALQLDSLCIRFHITHYAGCQTGDKCVFGAQLKSEISEVFHNTITTADGKPVDGFYGGRGTLARVVGDIFGVGTTTPLLGTAGKQMAEIYKGTRKP